MSIKQKLIIDKELTNNIQIIVRDETGLYNPSNLNGYGGNNGSPVNKFEKYIFELYNKYTNVNYRQVQSDDLNNPDEYYNPSINRIVNKENVTISSSNFNINNFDDGLYSLFMNVQLSDIYNGNGILDADNIISVINAQILYDNYKAIIANEDIYLIQGIVNNVIILNKPITTAFTSFKPILRTSIDFILSDKLKDCINIAIAKLADNCKCEDTTDIVNQLSELQLYNWGIDRALEDNDISQAYEYFILSKSLSLSLKNKCND